VPDLAMFEVVGFTGLGGGFAREHGVTVGWCRGLASLAPVGDVDYEQADGRDEPPTCTRNWIRC